MRTIICGSRSIWQAEHLYEALRLCGWADEITLVISGGATGADRLGEQYARAAGLPIERYSADWERHGRKAGIIRNAHMVSVADAMIALWDGVSRGTADTIQRAIDKKLPKMYAHAVYREEEDE